MNNTILTITTIIELGLFLLWLLLRSRTSGKGEGKSNGEEQGTNKESVGKAEPPPPAPVETAPEVVYEDVAPKNARNDFLSMVQDDYSRYEE